MVSSALLAVVVGVLLAAGVPADGAGVLTVVATLGVHWQSKKIAEKIMRALCTMLFYFL